MAFDWERAIKHGLELAGRDARCAQSDENAMWELFKEAWQTAALTYAANPRTGFPTKSQMPESADEVSMWIKLRAYYAGEIDEIPETDSKPPRPSSEQITRSEIILSLFHKHALKGVGDWKRLRKALALRATGKPFGLIYRITGINRKRIERAKQRAMRDMLDKMRAE